MKNIAILASGNGSNFEAIAKAVKRGCLKADLKLLITDKQDAWVRQRAKKFKVRDVFIDPKNFQSRQDFDRQVVKVLKQEKINLVVLAGFMRILSAYFCRSFRNKILNIHPALLPSFKGAHAIKDALRCGVKITGVTVHFVDEKMDHGPIVRQEAIAIREKESLKSLEQRIHKIEHQLYPRAIKLFLEGNLKVRKRRVVIASRRQRTLFLIPGRKISGLLLSRGRAV